MDERLKNIVDNYDKMRIGVDEPFPFHCTMCGKCCINREDILLTPRDIFNMSKELEITVSEFFKEYCEAYIGGDSRMPIVRLKPRGSVKRCPLLKDRKCSVHKAKPAVCAMFPIGRCLRYEPGQDIKVTVDQVEYIFNNPGCGDDAEIHTVREWLNEFGISTEDMFFVKWQQAVVELSTIFRECEKKMSNHTMELLWNAALFGLYFKYDMKKEFMPQFEENSQEFIGLMHTAPISQGDEKDE